MPTVPSLVSTSMRLRALASPAGNSPAPAVATGRTTSATGARSSAAKAVDNLDRIKASGNKKIDTLLAGGNHWFHEEGASGTQPADTARHSLTYNFIASPDGLSSQDARGFQAFDDDQRARVREALAYISTVIDVSFTEVSAGGDFQ